MREMRDEHYAVLRRHMVEVIAIRAELAGEELGKAALDPRVMAALGRVPRHLFVPATVTPFAYHDLPLPRAEPREQLGRDRAGRLDPSTLGQPKPAPGRGGLGQECGGAHNSTSGSPPEHARVAAPEDRRETAS